MSEWIEWMHRRAIKTHERIRYTIIGMRNANANAYGFVVCGIECIFKTSSVSLCLVHMHQLRLQCVCVVRARNTKWMEGNIDGYGETVNSCLGSQMGRDTRKMQIAEMQKKRTPSQLWFFFCVCLKMHPIFPAFVLCCAVKWKRSIQLSHYNCFPRWRRRRANKRRDEKMNAFCIQNAKKKLYKRSKS